MQGLSHGRVLEIERHNGLAQPSPLPRGGPGARLVELLSSVRELSFSLSPSPPSARILHAALAGLTGAVWAFSLGSLLLSTGWSAVFYLGYAAASAGFTVLCALVAVNVSYAEENALSDYADNGRAVRTTWIARRKVWKKFRSKTSGCASSRNS
jgi:hypothetical protein